LEVIIERESESINSRLIEAWWLQDEKSGIKTKGAEAG